jgi:folate-dependent phosphoribosylglycinamide formyltransferase PurN
LANLAVFAYNFPHKKTQDFLWRLLTEGLKPRVVVAQDRTELDIPEPTLRVKPRHIFLVHPLDICRTFDIEYRVVDHNSSRCQQLLRSCDVDVAVISGARILGKPTICSVAKGIINLHPGLIPEVRGLDALQWAIYEGHPIGATAHVIDERVDAGRVIERRVIEEYPDDSFLDLSLRLHETQVNMVSNAVRTLRSTQPDALSQIGVSRLHRKMPPELEATLPGLLDRRLKGLDTRGGIMSV